MNVILGVLFGLVVGVALGWFAAVAFVCGGRADEDIRRMTDEERNRIVCYVEKWWSAKGYSLDECSAKEAWAYDTARFLIETWKPAPKVSLAMLEADDGPIARLTRGPMWFRGPLPEYGKAAVILADWLRSIGVEVVEGGE